VIALLDSTPSRFAAGGTPVSRRRAARIVVFAIH
jgi:hypothetical protein